MAPFLHLDRHSMKTYLRFFPLFLAMASILLFQQNCIKEYEGLIGFRCSKETETSQECGGKPCRGGRCGACVENAQCSGGEVCCVPNPPPNADPAVRYCRPSSQCGSSGESQTEGTPEPSNEPTSSEEPAQPENISPPDGAEETSGPENLPEPAPEVKVCAQSCAFGEFCCDGVCLDFTKFDNCGGLQPCDSALECPSSWYCCGSKLGGQKRCVQKNYDALSCK